MKEAEKFIEASLLLAALVGDEEGGKERLSQMTRFERKALQAAIVRLDGWIEDMEGVSEDERANSGQREAV